MDNFKRKHGLTNYDLAYGVYSLPDDEFIEHFHEMARIIRGDALTDDEDWIEHLSVFLCDSLKEIQFAQNE